jgi:RHS repeat-associated protein
MIETYTYAADGKRRQKVTASATTNYLWDGENVLAEQDGNLVTQAQYTQAPALPGGLVSQRRGATSSFYGFDAAANARALLSASAAVTDTYSYKAFGPELPGSGGTTNPHRYGGQMGYYRDTATRLYVRARHLSVPHGRWMSLDPLGGVGGDVNPYCYAFNDPLAYADPSGAVALPLVPPVVVLTGEGITVGVALGGVGILILVGVGIYYFARARSRRIRVEDICADLRTACFLTSLADLGALTDWRRGGDAAGRCGACFDQCIQNGGVWPSSRPTGNDGETVDCSYWNYPRSSQ